MLLYALNVDLFGGCYGVNQWVKLLNFRTMNAMNLSSTFESSEFTNQNGTPNWE